MAVVEATPWSLLCGLSREEQKASRTFLNHQTRIEYIASRFCMRLLASKYLGIGRFEIALRKTAMGRPLLLSLHDAGACHLNISLSHCARGIAIAFAHRTRIGVDLEMHRPTETVARWLVGAERTAEPRQILDCWTRKEALLKGLGLGLFGLASAPSLENRTNVVAAGIAIWTVNSLSVAPDCSLACAAEKAQSRIRLLSSDHVRAFIGAFNATKVIPPTIQAAQRNFSAVASRLAVAVFYSPRRFQAANWEKTGLAQARAKRCTLTARNSPQPCGE